MEAFIEHFGYLAILIGTFHFAPQIVFGRILPGLAVTLFVGMGTFVYFAVKLAAVEAQLDVAGSTLELYRSATDMKEKRRLLEFIGMTGSDKILEIVDEALGGGQ